MDKQQAGLNDSMKNKSERLMANSKKLIFVICAALVSTSAVAAVLEEIVVTAQKREQNIQDVGIAITAMTGDQLEALGYGNAQEVTRMAAGVSTVQPNGEANYAMAIRGVAANDFTTNVESPVAIYLDEVYISQMSGAGFALFDMERVEILKGPQGTLYGRNATGGLAHFLSVKPSQEREGYAKVTFGDYDQIKLEGAIGGALSDTLSARLSVTTHDNDGYVTNRLGGDLNNADDSSYRLQFLWQPSDQTEVLLSLRGADQDIDTGFFEHVTSLGEPGELTPDLFNYVLGYQDTDGDVFAGDYDDPGYNDLETRGYSLTIKHDFDNVSFTSITDLSTVERKYIEDSDASPAPVFNFFLNTDAEQFSQEFRLNGENESMKWVVGVYYMDLDIKDSNGAITDPFVGPAATPGAEAGLSNPYTSDLQSTSVFGQIEYALSETLNLVVGARAIKDEKDFEYAINVVEFLDPEARNFDSSTNMNNLATLATYSGSTDDTEVSARLSLDWLPNENSLYYVSWNRGVKGAGFNAPIFPLSPPSDYNDATMSYGPEQLDAFEVGAKWSFMDGLARINVAAYSYDYEDYQAFNIIGIDTLTVNAEADSQGFEIEAQLSPGDGWDVLVGIAYNDIDVELPGGVDTTSVQSPEWATNLMIRKEWMLDIGVIAVQFDTMYRSEHYFSLTQAPAVTENGYSLSNVRVSYTTSDDRWQAVAFIDNVTDEEYLVQTFDLSTDAVFGMTEQYYGKPKWWGVSLKYNF